MRGDPRIARAAVQNNPTALFHCSAAAKKDKKLVLIVSRDTLLLPTLVYMRAAPVGFFVCLVHAQHGFLSPGSACPVF